MLKDNALFVQEFFRTFHSTGSLCPTTRWAASAMVAPLSEKPQGQPSKILELGPGTGSVTQYILRTMGFGDSLATCEINERFMDALKDNLEDDPYFDTHRARVSFHCCPMQQLPETQKFDVIVCAIPFLNFDLPLVKELFAKIAALSHENTVMTYYEYIALRDIGKIFSANSRRKRMRELDDFIIKLQKSHLQSRSNVWLNVLPIKVYRLNKLNELGRIIDA
jgi:phospholipid N-methyltransferase